MQMFPSDQLVALSVLRKGRNAIGATPVHTSTNHANNASANNASTVFLSDQGRDQRVATPGYTTSPPHHSITTSAARASGSGSGPGLGPASSSSHTHVTPPRMRVGEGMGVGESGMDSPLPPTRGAASGQGLGLGGDIHASPPPHRTPSSVAALRSSQVRRLTMRIYPLSCTPSHTPSHPPPFHICPFIPTFSHTSEHSHT